MNLFLKSMVISVMLSSCGLESPSSIKDAGLVNTQDGSTKVIYADQNKVYLKVCKPTLAPPLTRNCPSDATPKYLDLATYLYKLPYDVGPYQRDDQGLSFVTKALQDANNAVAGGNQSAVPTVEKLTPIKLNLEKILKISKDLNAPQQDLTYYEYQDEFQKLLSPFGDTGSGSSPVGMTFVRIPKGTFLMGSDSSEAGRDDEIQHRVTITYDFFMQTTEVTQEQWYNVMGDNPSKFIADQDCPGQYKQVNRVGMCPSNPVEQVSWHDAQLFIQKLNDKRDGYRYRLPTEAEWEYAARGGSSGPYSVAGNLADFAWYVDDSGNKTHAVGKLKPNGFGLYDVHGNVWEWTSDWYGPYSSSNATDPVGASSGSYRVMRGGSWWSDARYCRSADRGNVGPGIRGSIVGFRLVRTSSP